MLYIPVLLYNTISDSIIFMILSHLYIKDRSSIRSSSSSSSSRYLFLCLQYRSVYYSFVRIINITVYRAFVVFCTMTRVEKSTRKKRGSLKWVVSVHPLQYDGRRVVLWVQFNRWWYNNRTKRQYRDTMINQKRYGNIQWSKDSDTKLLWYVFIVIHEK